MNNKILNTKNILALSVLAATAVTSVNVMAEGIGHGSATVKVKNSFVVTEATALNFGLVRATASSLPSADASAVTANTASMIMSPIDGTYTADSASVSASIAGLGDGTPGVFSMEKVGAYKNFEISVPAIELKKAGAESTDPYFHVTDFTFYLVDAVDSTTGKMYDATNSVYLKSDADENAFFRVGATLATSAMVAAGQANYDDMDYTGTYDVTVNYK